MIFIDKMKNLKIYKSPMFLPTIEDNKKKGSAILLLTPDYPSSKKMMEHRLFINNLRFSSYYIDKAVSYYINSKNVEEVEESTIDVYNEFRSYNFITEMSSEERNNLPNSAFGLPGKRKYPLDTPERVKSAIRFFNYCNEDEEEELASNIIKAIKKFNMNDIKVGKNNRFAKYYYSINEANLSNLTWYHLEKVRKGFNPKSNAVIWDEELYSKSIDYAINNDIKFEDNENKVEAHVYTAGEELSPIYLGKISIWKTSLDGWLNWEWSEQEPIPDTIIDYLKDEVHKHLLEQIEYVNDKGKEVPKVCPKCGSKVCIYLRGEPVFLCSNKKCNKFFGVVPFDDSDEESVKESLNVNTDYFVKSINESSSINTGDKLIIFNEDATNDAKLRTVLYQNRIRKREEVILLYDRVKKDLPFIKYTYPEFNRYQNNNVFVDLYYYNKIFFENNDWINNKGFRLYLDFMTRLINNPNIKSYQRKTIFIPITDWEVNGAPSMVWNYRVSLNPLSIIYHMMYSGMGYQLKSLFGDTNIVFIAHDKYFKLNFSEIELSDVKRLSVTFKTFLMKICKNEEFDYSDIDTANDNAQSPDVIKANILDKIELAKGVDLTAKLAAVQKEKKINGKGLYVGYDIKKATSQDSNTIKKIENNKEVEDKVISKATLNQARSEKKIKIEANKKKLAEIIDDIADNATSEDDALDIMDTEEIKQIIIDLDSGDDDKVDISAGRASRISELDKKLMETEIKGKSVKEILEPSEKKEEKITELDIATPNESWNQLKFMNFDKYYDIDKDIISCFRHFGFTSRPISIKNMTVEDNSTSEDRVELYTVEMEDYRGKRYTIKLDIPIMIDNRFLLRGNSKSIQTQFCNMPIIKTDFDTCQIISNYMKIFVRRFGSGNGKSIPRVSKFIKAVNKYTGRKIKFYLGDNKKICSKYELPIDYIDLSGVISKIETDDFIIYFNQDEIRKLYTIEEGLGIPYKFDKHTKHIVYADTNSQFGFISTLISDFTVSEKYQDFVDLIYSSSAPSVCSYSRCSIMNSQIPLVVICAYHEGLRKTLEKANVNYKITSTLSKEDRQNLNNDWIKFKDGYIIFESTYESSLLLNGLKDCPTDLFEISNIDNKNMYLEFLDNFGGRIKADGLDNFYDLMLDPITKEILDFYKLPVDYISILLYANALLADNKFIKHTDTSSRRIRRYELIAVYTYKVLANAYAYYANQLKHSREAAEFSVKQSAVIDMFLLDTITSDDSCINALRDVETTNAITTKGPSGMNTDRAYSLDKRTYDESMLNVLGMSTGFAANVGITRQATIDANIEGERGYVKNINGDTSKMSSSKTLTATEALTPFGTTRDDPIRTAMTFIQTSKHMVRTEDSDPLLVTNGSDEAMPYLTSDKFAFKAKKEGKIEELTSEYIMIAYNDGTKDYINLKETIEKNSDGGYYVPLKLDAIEGLKVGSKVTENQIVAYDKYSFSNSVGESNNLAYNIGKLAKVAIVNTDEGFEDSGIITERMANKLATRVDLKFDVTLDMKTDVLSIAKIGDKVEVGDNLLVWQSPFDDEEANALMKTLTGEDVSELGKRRLKSEVTGVVTAIKMFRTIELDDMSDSLRKIVEDYEKPLIALKEKLKANNLDISQVPAHYILPPTGKLKKAQNAVVIEFFVEYKDTVGIGDKVVYFSANKAVEKNIIPLGKEPYTAFRPNEPIDAFVSEVSIDKRMVTSTVIYGSLQKLMIELDRSVKDIMGIPYDDTTV